MASLALLWTAVLVMCIGHMQGKTFIRLCYFPNWAHQRKSEYTRYDVQDIDPSLCTHLAYAFAEIDSDTLGLVPISPTDDPSPGQPGRYRRFNDLKQNRHLKTLLSVGGENAGSARFIAIASDDTVLQNFADTTVQFLRKRGFDGLDIDWEYPDAITKALFSKLLQTLRTAFEEEQSDQPRLLLTVALPAGRHRIDDGFQVDEVNRYTDLANLMAYDYHGAWNLVTGFDSPLLSRQSDPSFNQELSTAWTVNYYLSKGLAVDKMLVGVTAAGTRFLLQNDSITGVGAPVVTSNTPRLSELWELPDRYAYPEVCRVLQLSGASRVYDEEQQVPYAYHNRDWFGYEDPASLQNKVEWMLKKGVAGVMFWALDMDDFTGKVCDAGPYPLLRAISSSLSQPQGNPPTDDVNPNNHYPNGNDVAAVVSVWVLGAVTALGYFALCSFAW